MPTDTQDIQAPIVAVTVTPIAEPEPEKCLVCERDTDDCECVTCEGRCGKLLESVCSNCNRCENDCNCWYCEYCSESHSENTDRCSNCERCVDNCECSFCDSCDTSVHYDSWCSSCERCNECCDCNDLYVKNAIQWHTGTNFKVNKSKRYISVEIEVATVNNNDIKDTVNEWGGSIVEDGSIRGDKPFEINTAPASGDQFLKQVDEICNTLRNSGGKANESCGLHVHIDARNENFHYMKKLAYLYAKIEDALFSIVAPSRRQSTYSKPCGAKLIEGLEAGRVPKDVEKTLIKNIYQRDGIDIQQKKTEKYDSSRYSALNLHSWIYRGTVECRMHHGTVNATKIKNWGMLWAGILDYAENNSETYIKNMKGDSLSCLLSVCQNDTVRAWVVERHNQFNGVSSTNEGDQ